MFDNNDPSLLWVSASATDDKGDGTAEKPFSGIERALGIVQPGQTIVLKAGSYSGTVNFEISGTLHQPIRIMADTGANVEITGACWFFYDSSDLIVSGFTFKYAPVCAISVVGSCERNRFENLRFLNCGTSEKTSCTLFFGGSGGNCNVVENCSFEHAATVTVGARAQSSGMMSIGLMVSEGDADHGAPITNHVYRRNRFVNYDYGILIGTNDSSSGLYGHIVEYNTVENSAVEGILVKCGDTQVRGNLVRRCGNNSIDIAAGKGSVIEENRVVDCGNGIRVNDADHTIVNNCVIRCGGQAVRACGEEPGVGIGRAAATNLFIEDNTFIDCGTPATQASADGDIQTVAGVRIDPGTTCIIRHNLVAGMGQSVAVIDPLVYAKEHGLDPENLPMALWVAADNLADSAVSLTKGFAVSEVVFTRREADDFTNDSGFGAEGWMLKPETFDPDLASIAESEKYCHTDNFDDDDDAPVVATEEVVDNEFDFESFMGNLFQPDVKKDEL